MHRSTTLFLIGLCLIAILGFNFFVVQTSALIGAVIVVGIVFISGAITGYFLAKYTATTVYESGVEKDDYLINIGRTLEAQLKNAYAYAENTENLANGLRYLWFRKAEYTAQYFINESTFPKEKVAQESGLEDHLINITSALLRSVDSIIGMHSVFCAETLSAFDTLDVKSWISSVLQISLKGSDALGLFRKKSGEDVKTIELYGIYHKIPAHQGDWFGIYEYGTSSVPFNISIYDVETNELVAYKSATMSGGSKMQKWFKVDLSNCVEGNKYKLVLSLNLTNAPSDLTFVVPIDFIPYEPTDMGSYSIYHIVNRTDSSTGVGGFEFYSDSEMVYEIKFYSDDALKVSKLTNAVSSILEHYEDALDSGQTYWNYLRMLGYTDINQVPKSFKIPAPSVVDMDSTVTQKLTPEQLYALYVAYLKALEQFFTSETYRQANVTSVDVKMVDFSIVVNCTAYSGADNSTIFDKKLAILMPTVENLTLYKGQNNTLTQTVNCVYYDNSTLANQTMNYVQLISGDKVYVYDIYVEGEPSESNNVTIAIVDLRQVALLYDFKLEGEPTYTYTQFQDWIPIIITVLMVSMVIAIIDRSRRKRR